MKLWVHNFILIFLFLSHLTTGSTLNSQSLDYNLSSTQQPNYNSNNRYTNTYDQFKPFQQQNLFFQSFQHPQNQYANDGNFENYIQQNYYQPSSNYQNDILSNQYYQWNNYYDLEDQNGYSINSIYPLKLQHIKKINFQQNYHDIPQNDPNSANMHRILTVDDMNRIQNKLYNYSQNLLIEQIIYLDYNEQRKN